MSELLRWVKPPDEADANGPRPDPLRRIWAAIASLPLSVLRSLAYVWIFRHRIAELSRPHAARRSQHNDTYRLVCALVRVRRRPPLLAMRQMSKPRDDTRTAADKLAYSAGGAAEFAALPRR